MILFFTKELLNNIKISCTPVLDLDQLKEYLKYKFF